ncbi:hypothetical protein LAUMK35_04380 [Mycobacterium pseudokansasii]|nr:hypothetical protein LAUMK35_04380 [Mycobacterium pseudokansasii]VBA30760.1 hypothetical protein LAUMK21_04373 [Mycobacterium pseudokansasii]
MLDVIGLLLEPLVVQVSSLNPPCAVKVMASLPALIWVPSLAASMAAVTPLVNATAPSAAAAPRVPRRPLAALE